MKTKIDVYLFGDSIIENSAYVKDNHDVSNLIHSKLKTPSRLSNFDIEVCHHATDGALTADIRDQVRRAKLHGLRRGATSIAVFTGGGNDALGSLDYLKHRQKNFDISTPEFLDDWRYWTNVYNELLEELIYDFHYAMPCTIYNEIPTFDAADKLIFRLYNDYIIQKAIKLELTYCDIRTVMESPTDYASVSPIEPSETGGDWIAELIVQHIDILLTNKIRSSRPYQSKKNVLTFSSHHDIINSSVSNP